MKQLIGIVAMIYLASCGTPGPGDHGSEKATANDWPVYQGDDGRNQYSSLKQINKQNINRLSVAWEYRTGDAGERTQIQCNPIVIDGVLYASSPKLKVFALNAATGDLIWEFQPKADVNFSMNVNRGLVYWENAGQKQIMFTAGSMLFAIDATTGKPVETFGAKGVVSLKQNLGERSDELYVVSTTPGVIYKDLLIIGTRVLESADAAPGHISAFNIRTGEVAWTFYTIPQPGQPFYDTWPENAYKEIGGANSWAGMSIDREKGMLFVPTGSAAFDFWGGNRKGQNLFANCIIALNAATGERIWHYQTVHHDLWDRDLPAPPNLVTVKHEGREIEALAQITKSGFVFVLDRATGKPLFPVEQRPVPPSDLKGEETWPTQPFPLKPPPFARQQFTEDEITDISSEAQAYVKQRFEQYRAGDQFIPPSIEGTVLFPGFDGGGEWGGASVDPITGVMYVNASEMPYILQMQPAEPDENALAETVGQRTYRMNCGVCHGQQRQGDPSGTYPPLVDIAEKMPEKEIVAIINNGSGFMPSFKHISEEKVEALVDFLLGHQEEVADAHMLGMDANKNDIPYTFVGYNRFLDEEGYPAVKPPWGLLNAIDLNKGEILWQVPLGEFKELTKRGIPKTGTENYGGPVATAGGLVFIGGSKDEHFRAFDRDTGDELWTYKLPAGGYATPSIYAVNGKQYVVIACGGGKMGTASGDSYVAFSLDE